MDWGSDNLTHLEPGHNIYIWVKLANNRMEKIYDQTGYSQLYLIKNVKAWVLRGIYEEFECFVKDKNILHQYKI